MEHAAGDGGKVINRFMHKNRCSVDNYVGKADFPTFFVVKAVSKYLFERLFVFWGEINRKIEQKQCPKLFTLAAIVILKNDNCC